MCHIKKSKNLMPYLRKTIIPEIIINNKQYFCFLEKKLLKQKTVNKIKNFPYHLLAF